MLNLYYWNRLHQPPRQERQGKNADAGLLQPQGIHLKLEQTHIK